MFDLWSDLFNNVVWDEKDHIKTQMLAVCNSILLVVFVSFYLRCVDRIGFPRFSDWQWPFLCTALCGFLSVRVWRSKGQMGGHTAIQTDSISRRWYRRTNWEIQGMWFLIISILDSFARDYPTLCWTRILSNSESILRNRCDLMWRIILVPFCDHFLRRAISMLTRGT